MKEPCYFGFSWSRERPIKPCFTHCPQGRSWDKCMFGKKAEDSTYSEKGLSYKQRSEKDQNFVSENEIKIKEENEAIRISKMSQLDRIEEKIDKLLKQL